MMDMSIVRRSISFTWRARFNSQQLEI